jgi:hypothetical protein
MFRAGDESVVRRKTRPALIPNGKAAASFEVLPALWAGASKLPGAPV